MADVGQAHDVDALFAATTAELGSAAIVVNNAGNSTLDLIENLPEHDWDSVLTTHLKGTYLASKAAIRQMRTAGLHGSIINLGSVETFATTRGNAHYSAAKAGIDKFNFTRIQKPTTIPDLSKPRAAEGLAETTLKELEKDPDIAKFTRPLR